MNLLFLKKQNKWTLVALLAVIVLVYLAYNCYQKKEYFVVKANTPMGEILLDQTDFAEIINGMKPKHVKGDFTADDLSELVRELKKNTIVQYKTHCKKNPRSCPSYGKVIVSLIDEMNKDKTGKMNKSQWIDAIVTLGKSTFFKFKNGRSGTPVSIMPVKEEPSEAEPVNRGKKY